MSHRDTYREQVEAELRVRCVWLRTKKSYFAMPEPSDHESETPTACWWCLKTLEALGPDGSTAARTSCSDGSRVCYEPPIRL